MPVDVATSDAQSTDRLTVELSGLDALELAENSRRSALGRIWSAVWPKAGAAAIGLLIWQAVVWSGWKPDYILPGPNKVFPELKDMTTDGTLGHAVVNTFQRAVIGFSLATVIGILVGAVVSRVRILRVAFGSFITGLQTMPSIAWFPLAIVLFKLTEGAIIFVVVIGAAPSIANGLISGTDTIPPLLLRAGRVLGAKGLTLYRHVILPACLPSFIAGVKQGWAFAWRSLLAGELLVIIANKPSIGVTLTQSRELSDYPRMMATMLVILFIGIIIDSLVFGTIERGINRRRGLKQT
jgi:NitT/TauT family transport system permease protein